MNDDIEVYLDKVSSGACYLESLIYARARLDNAELKAALDEVILLEIELAKMGAEKAKSEIIKANKDNLRPIK